jgi:cyanophycinase-like exopeptidase
MSKAPGSVYLVGSSRGGTMAEVVRRVGGSVRPRSSNLRVALSLAALPTVNGEAQTRALARSLFPGAVVERFAVEGEADAPRPAEARATVEQADVLFFGGGDPVLAARRLVEAGADEWVREARASGATCIGLSAGSIALAAFWADWPADDPDAEPTLVRCIGAAPRVVVDCHAEADDWEELRLVQRRMGSDAAELTFAGIGHGSALVVGAHDELSWIGPGVTLSPVARSD